MRGVAAVIAVLLLLFCLSSVAPSLAAETGCQGPDSSVRFCGQSGLADPIPVVVSPVFLMQGDQAATASLPWRAIALLVPQFHGGPSTPRAPPFSLV